MFYIMQSLCKLIIAYCLMRIYTIYDYFEIVSIIFGWQIPKGEKGALFYSRMTVYDGKGQTVQ